MFQEAKPGHGQADADDFQKAVEIQEFPGLAPIDAAAPMDDEAVGKALVGENDVPALDLANDEPPAS